MIEKGMILRCKTTTKNDMFGIVMWEVVDTGLPAPEWDRKGQMDGVKVVMLGGSGPSARKGMTLIDSEKHILDDVRDGVTTIVPTAQKDAMLVQFEKREAKAEHRHGGTGVVEV